MNLHYLSVKRFSKPLQYHYGYVSNIAEIARLELALPFDKTPFEGAPIPFMVISPKIEAQVRIEPTYSLLQSDT